MNRTIIFKLRLPQDLHEAIKHTAWFDRKSMHSYIVKLLADAMEPPTTKGEK